jgi:hypothetical protein
MFFQRGVFNNALMFIIAVALLHVRSNHILVLQEFLFLEEPQTLLLNLIPIEFVILLKFGADLNNFVLDFQLSGLKPIVTGQKDLVFFLIQLLGLGFYGHSKDETTEAAHDKSYRGLSKGSIVHIK